MASERMRKILPYVSIGVGILVYVLYYFSTQSWKQAQSDYEKQQVEERQANKRADKKYMSETKPWISGDGKEVFKIISREKKDGLVWIRLKELIENVTYNLRNTKSASGEKYSSNAGNVFWIKGDEAVFENAEGKKSELRQTKIFKGLFSYMADANSFVLCDESKSVSIAFLGENATIENAYSKIGRSGEKVYLEIEGAMIQEMSMEGTKMIDAIYPYLMISMEDVRTCN